MGAGGFLKRYAKGKKVIYEVFQYIDTEKSLEVTEPYLKYIKIEGKTINSWADLVEGFDVSQIATRPLPYALTAREARSVRADRYAASFDVKDDFGGWQLADYTDTISIKNLMPRKPEKPYRGEGALEIRFATSDYTAALTQPGESISALMPRRSTRTTAQNLCLPSI